MRSSCVLLSFVSCDWLSGGFWIFTARFSRRRVFCCMGFGEQRRGLRDESALLERCEREFVHSSGGLASGEEYDMEIPKGR